MAIVLDNITYTYGMGTPFEKTALRGVSLTIENGEFLGVIGHTGSGKSTFVQHLNGLLHPTTGTVTVNGVDISASTEEAKKMRHKVGMVFQYPEHQLFEETIAQDIAFGPKNLGLSADDVDERVRDAMKFVGLDYDTYAERSPFHLSGGQMRRVAIAGVVAMDPDFLVLDEPSAGLDPFGREEIFEEIIRLHKEKGITVILVSHNMEDISRMASRLVVLDKGRIVLDGEPMDIFNNHRDELQAVGVDVPPVSVTMEYLREQGLDVSNRVLSVDVRYKQFSKEVTMLNNITIGQYFPGNSFLHRMDPRAKIIATTIFVVAIFLANSPLAYGVVGGFTIFSMLLSRLPLRLMWSAIKPLWIIIVFTMGIHIFTTPGNPIFQWGIINITDYGVAMGLQMAARLIFLILFSSLLTYTTSPIRLTDGIEHLLNPFRRIGVPAHELAMMMTIALRFIPTLLDETDRIMKAQSARGADFVTGSIIQRAKNMVPLLVPLFISAFRRADELAIAMEARCYRGGVNRTRMKELQVTYVDYIGVGAVVLITIILIALWWLGL